MKVKISYFLFTIIILITPGFISVFPQVIEKNGVLFKDFSFEPSEKNLSNILKDNAENLQSDPIQPPVIKSDFIVNSFDGEYGADQGDVRAAMDGDGNYAFTWIDFRSGREEIYAQFFNNNNDRMGMNFKVNDEPIVGNNSPFIAANKSGDFIIVWLKDFQNIVAQRFTKTGQNIGANIQVNSLFGYNTMPPSVAINNDGSFIVTWASESGWQYKVYARLFNSAGNPVGPEIYVSDPGLGNSSIGIGKHIDVDFDGNYCIVWSSGSGGSNSNIYFQILNSDGQRIGPNTIVSSNNDSSNNIFPEVSSTDDGHFLIVWEKNFGYPLGGGVGARIYNADGFFVDDEFLLFSDQYSSWHPARVTSDRDSTFLVLWLGWDSQFFQKIKSSGEFLSDTVRVRYNPSKQIFSYEGGLTNIYNGNFFVAPEVYERNDGNIYLQKYSNELLPVGSLTKLHDDQGSAWQKKPLICFNKEGESIFVWEDERNGRYDLFAQVYDKDYNAKGVNLQINEINLDYWFLYDKKVESLSDGKFVIAFSGHENYSNGTSVFLQLVNNTGELIGNNKLVKNQNYYSYYNVSLNVNDFDEILLCWYDRYGANMRIYDKSLNAKSDEKILLQSTNQIAFSPVTLSIDKAFNIMAMWMDYNRQNYQQDNKIKGRFFNEEGKPDGNVFIIDSVNSYITNFECKNQGHDYAILYKTYYKIYLLRKYSLEKEYKIVNTFNSYGYVPTQTNIVSFDNQKIFITYNSMLDVFGFYSNDNKRKSEYYLLHTYDYIDPYYEYNNSANSTVINNNNLLFSYENGSNQRTGYDIWANVKKIDNVNFDPEMFFPPVYTDVLYNNYPNPFNTKTKITYELLTNSKVKLAVYDILGREVKVLVNENQEKGIYEVDFDASGFASGIYFYKLEAFQSIVKKMILLK